MSNKKGGPYTKAEQEKRRDAVFEMHFEKGYLAGKIAKELDINKNTVTEDIRYWYEIISAELKEHAKDWTLRQYSRMEEQRARLTELLKKQDNVMISLKIEKMIMDLDRTISKFVAPIYEKTKSAIPDYEAISIVENLLLNEDAAKATGYSEKQLLCDIIKSKKCDVYHATAILDKAKELGLDLFLNHTHPIEPKNYDLLGFAEARQILSNEKLQKMYHRLEEKEQEQKEEIAQLELRDREIEAKFVEQYGDSSTWSPDTWAKFNYESGYS